MIPAPSDETGSPGIPGTGTAGRPTGPAVPSAAPAPRRNAHLSLRRGVEVLQLVARETERGVGVTEIAAVLGVHHSTASRLAGVLEELELLKRDAHGRYRLGAGSMLLGQQYLAGLDLREIAASVLRTREWPITPWACTVLVREETSVRAVLQLRSRPPSGSDQDGLGLAARPGEASQRSGPLYATGGGKAILSVSDPVWIDRTIKTGLRPLTHRTITDPTELRSELTRTRVRGFAVDDRERDQLTRAVAAPVFGFSGDVVGAVELSAPVTSLPSVVLRSAGEAVVAAGRALSEAMGSKIRSTRTREV